VETASATEAVELAQRILPDLILLDLNLERYHEGLIVCRALRDAPNPALAEAPIVMLTGTAGQAGIKAALAAGANTYLREPYSPLAIMRLVRTLLAKAGPK
jgi:CheY-like chemotaxis protein